MNNNFKYIKENMKIRLFNLLLIGSVVLSVMISSCNKDNDDASGNAPIAAFTASNTNIDQGTSISFTDQSPNTPTTWSWNFGDGSTSSNQHPSHIYSSEGIYTIELTVTNSFGSNTKTKTNYINVNASGTLPIANFSSNNTIITQGDSIIFTDLSTNIPTLWLWDFGDGDTSSQASPTHTFNSVGTYSITLTVSNSIGSDTKIKSNYITVNTHSISGAGLTDIDGNNYTSVIIGNQEWMTENLKVTHYPNGDAIPYITDNTDWVNLTDDDTSDAYCYYNNNLNSEANTYGAIYTYAAAIGDNWVRDNSTNQGVCPDGWHLPTDADWTTLTNNLGGENVAGGKMKKMGTSHWNSPNTGADNSSGFSALPGGYRSSSDGMYKSMGVSAYMRGNADDYGSFGNYRSLSYGNAKILRSGTSKSDGFSVRCIKD